MMDFVTNRIPGILDDGDTFDTSTYPGEMFPSWYETRKGMSLKAISFFQFFL
jgi:hypothetical protein